MLFSVGTSAFIKPFFIFFEKINGKVTAPPSFIKEILPNAKGALAFQNIAVFTVYMLKFVRRIHIKNKNSVWYEIVMNEGKAGQHVFSS